MLSKVDFYAPRPVTPDLLIQMGFRDQRWKEGIESYLDMLSASLCLQQRLRGEDFRGRSEFLNFAFIETHCHKVRCPRSTLAEALKTSEKLLRYRR